MTTKFALRLSVVCISLISILFTTGCASMRATGENKRDIIIRYAKNMLNKKYRYGVQDKHLGFDCSGLTQFAYREAGIGIPRTSRDQYARSEHINRNELQPADLVFFSTNGSGASHVGIYLGKNQFIHAPSEGKSVQIVSMNNSYWKKHYYGAGNYLK